MEPDACYYIRHEEVGRRLEHGDLTRQTPPDLAIEIDITRSSIPRQPIYAALGVPELWRWDGHQPQFLRLNERGHYQTVDYSLAFPFLALSDLQPFLGRFGQESDTAIRRAFQRWVRDRAAGTS